MREVRAAVGLRGLGSVINENVTIVLPCLESKARLAKTNTRAFVATSDPAWLKPGELPHPDAA